MTKPETPTTAAGGSPLERRVRPRRLTVAKRLAKMATQLPESVMVTASEMGKKGGSVTSEAKAEAARRNAAQPRAKALPKWMLAPAATKPDQGALLEAAAKVMREHARQLRAEGHKDVRRVIAAAESLECAADGRMTWAQAFDLE